MNNNMHAHTCTLTYTDVSFRTTQGKRQEDCTLCTEVVCLCVYVRMCMHVLVYKCVQDSESKLGQRKMYSVLCCSSIMEACCIMTA